MNLKYMKGSKNVKQKIRERQEYKTCQFINLHDPKGNKLPTLNELKEYDVQVKVAGWRHQLYNLCCQIIRAYFNKCAQNICIHVAIN